jgi:hypothetical protein
MAEQIRCRSEQSSLLDVILGVLGFDAQASGNLGQLATVIHRSPYGEVDIPRANRVIVRLDLESDDRVLPDLGFHPVDPLHLRIDHELRQVCEPGAHNAWHPPRTARPRGLDQTTFEEQGPHGRWQ